MKKPKPLATRLRLVSAMLRRDRQSFIDSERWPGRKPELDDEAKEIVAEYDAAIQAVKDAIALAEEVA